MGNFTEDKKIAVWSNAAIVPEDKDNGKVWRKDPCGAWINFNQYGDTEADYGWEIDHILPEAKNGTDHTGNLCAMHWKNNRSKADDFPSFNTATTSNGDKNVDSVETRKWNESTIKRLKELYPNNQHLKNC